MRDFELVNVDEPFRNLLTQGMVLNEIYFRKSESGRLVYYNPAEIEVKLDEKGRREYVKRIVQERKREESSESAPERAT